MTCVHCQQKHANRPRGLCWTCYYSDGVRDEHEKAFEAFVDEVVPSAPTLPIIFPRLSDEWYEAMYGRVVRRETLWHPGDAA